ncbi:hypothetical protein GCM10027074_56600 [Streptomyces deserti]
MRVQKRVGIPENLQIDPPKARHQPPAGPLDGLPQPVHVGQERQPLALRQVRQPLHRRIIHQQHRVPWQKLHVTDHGETRGQSPQHGGVLTPQRTADPVRPPVTLHGRRLSSPLTRNADDPRAWVLQWRSRPDVPATRGSGDCLGLGRLHASLTRWSGTALVVVADR